MVIIAVAQNANRSIGVNKIQYNTTQIPNAKSSIGLHRTKKTGNQPAKMLFSKSELASVVQWQCFRTKQTQH